MEQFMDYESFQLIVVKLAHVLPIEDLLKTLKLLPGKPFPHRFFHQVKNELRQKGPEDAAIEFCDLLMELRNSDTLAWLMIAADIIGNERLIAFIESQLNKVEDHVESARIIRLYMDKIDDIRNGDTLFTELELEISVTFGGDWPTVNGETFCERKECAEIISLLQILLNGPPGALVICGPGGIGKTTIINFILRNTLSRQLSSRHFGFVKRVIWLNAYQVSSGDTFCEQKFIDQLYEVLLKNCLITRDVTPDCDSITHGLKDSREKLLLVLDDVFNDGILKCISKLGPTVWAIALTRRKNKAAFSNLWFHSETYEMPLMSSEGIERILVDRYRLPETREIDRERQLPKLVKICLGLPLIADVIYANFKNKITRKEIKQTYLALVKDCEHLSETIIDVDRKGNCEKAQMTVSTLLSTSIELETLVDGALKPFLLFEPGQTVESIDLQIILGLQCESEVQRTYENAVDSSVLKRTANGGYILHDLLHKAVEKLYAKVVLQRATSLREIRRKLVAEYLHETKNRLVFAIVKNRKFLLRTIVDLGDSVLLANLSTENNFEALNLLIDKNLNGEYWMRFEGTNNESSASLQMFCHLSEQAQKFSRSVFEDSNLLDKICRTFSANQKWYQNVLFVAIKLGLPCLVDELLQNPKTVHLCRDFVDVNDNTALIFVCNVSGNLTVIEKLAAIIDPNKPNKRGETALWHCAKWYDALPKFQTIFEKSKEIIDVNVGDKIFGNTVLHEAVKFGRFDLVKFLVEEQSADITIANKVRNTNPTEYALAIRRQKVIGKWLLSRPECVVSEPWRRTASHLYPDLRDLIEKTKVIPNSNIGEVTNPIGSSDGEFTRLHSAANDNDLQQIMQLKDEDGASFEKMQEKCDEMGRTPLMYSCYDAECKIVKFLLQNGAQQVINHTDRYGDSALTIASEKGHIETIQLLINHGADYDVQNKAGATALTLAAENGDAEIVQLLINHKASLDRQTNAGWTALIYASDAGYLEIVRLLLDSGADLDFQTNADWTALMFASNSGHADIVQLLIDYGAKLDVQNNTGSTALILACVKGFAAIARLLIGNGAATDLKNKENRTAFVCASDKGFTEIAEMLNEIG